MEFSFINHSFRGNRTKTPLFHQARGTCKMATRVILNHFNDLCSYLLFYSVPEVGFWCICLGNSLTRNTSLSKKKTFFSSTELRIN